MILTSCLESKAHLQFMTQLEITSIEQSIIISIITTGEIFDPQTFLMYYFYAMQHTITILCNSSFIIILLVHMWYTQYSFYTVLKFLLEIIDTKGNSMVCVLNMEVEEKDPLAGTCHKSNCFQSLHSFDPVGLMTTHLRSHN